MKTVLLIIIASVLGFLIFGWIGHNDFCTQYPTTNYCMGK